MLGPERTFRLHHQRQLQLCLFLPSGGNRLPLPFLTVCGPLFHPEYAEGLKRPSFSETRGGLLRQPASFLLLWVNQAFSPRRLYSCPRRIPCSKSQKVSFSSSAPSSPSSIRSVAAPYSSPSPATTPPLPVASSPGASPSTVSSSSSPPILSARTSSPSSASPFRSCKSVAASSSSPTAG